MKKLLVALLIASAIVVTVPVASDVVDEIVDAQVEEVASADASFRVRSLPVDPGTSL
ncbi:hypothetical protein QA612_06780 [Evansella sp. AB-P1]|uniref:hypothetical protein n=1 Tax=Evansella sp. AB-P1 TaxID=3037653 RepID=UPI00241D667D|nr:hypothetical protein [Evansella sp. AB-P1]MDG5787192.1 hypothetical protein [Evansella sp. AB-P1]